MKVLELEYENYRNLKNSRFKPSDKINVIYGDNAQGKTNLLELIWIFTGGRSFRGTKDCDLIKFNEKNLEASLKVFCKERNQEFKIKILGKKRKVTINSVEKNSPSELVGKFCSVIFSPNHLLLIKDGPSLRRKFLDAAICQVTPIYAKFISSYNHILNQRNALIKDIKYHSELLDTLDIWDDRLAVYATEIIERRIQYVNYLKDFSKNFHEGISSHREILELIYETTVSLNEKDDLLNLIKEKFKKTRKTDIALGYTTVGPHRDDINILINKKSAKLFASQGQQRSAVLAIKLAEAEILKKVFQKTPVILLDDVMSELDEKRQNFILNSIQDNQVFITCCEPFSYLNLKNGAAFRVSNGEIT